MDKRYIEKTCYEATLKQKLAALIGRAMKTFLKWSNLVLGIANLWLAAIDNSVASLIIAALCLFVFYNFPKETKCP